MATSLPLFRSAGKPRKRDRKSTRLNSSHSQISYAVFCLKKKSPELDINILAAVALKENGLNKLVLAVLGRPYLLWSSSQSRKFVEHPFDIAGLDHKSVRE